MYIIRKRKEENIESYLNSIYFEGYELDNICYIGNDEYLVIAKKIKRNYL